MTLLATAATVIASQAVISGAFSLSQQAMQLSLMPRLDVHQTSEQAIGQVYVPQINWPLSQNPCRKRRRMSRTSKTC
jgi:KUP system potassium uptake protein